MKKRFVAALAALTILVLLLSPALAAAESAPVETTWTTRIGARFATVEEGQQWMRDRTLFHDQITETMLPFFLQKKGGTLKEYIEYSEAQVMAFTPEEEQRVLDVLDWLQGELKAHGLELPDPGEITFVKTTGQEAVGSAGYTSEGTVFLAWFTFSPEYYTDETFREIVVHELSHCLSRLFPEYRQALYSLIHFTVLDQDILGNLVEYICQDTDDTTWMVGEKPESPFAKWMIRKPLASRSLCGACSMFPGPIRQIQ
jgi:hypothetical protein